MIKSLSLPAILLALLCSGCAGTSAYMVRGTALPPSPPPDEAVVYFMRPGIVGAAINFQIWDKDRFIGLSQAKCYFRYVCEPGEHLFIAIAENKTAARVNVAAGQRYYILAVPRMGGWRARVELIPVTRDSKYWDKVDAYEQKLRYIEPKPELIQTWQEKKQTEVEKLVTFFESDPKRERYTVHLSADDGR